MDLDILDKFTTHLRNALSRSIDLAWELQHTSILPVFVLSSISEQKGSIGCEVLGKHNVSPDEVSVYISDTMKKRPASSKGTEDASSFLWPEFSPGTKKIIEHAAVLAYEFKHQYVGTEHLLLAMIDIADADVDAVLQQQEVKMEEIKKQLLQVMNSTSSFSAVQSMFGGPSQQQAPQDPQQGMQGGSVLAQETVEEFSETPALDFFGQDLTAPDQLGKLDPVIGRQDEIDRLVRILSRRTKNNPVLIGDPGVGKTAIVEGLARRVAEGKVPDVLLNKRLVSLDLSLILSGTMYRGEFESRIKQVVEELQTHTDIILFIDELHMLVGAGNVQGGSIDAANMLKPALAKGSLRCIGATTSEEYRKHIEQDSALERRFQPIQVDEPTIDEAVEILQGLRDYYEQYHHVRIPNDVIDAAVRLSTRFLPDKFLPDKAIDLVDEAGAAKHVERTVPKAMKDLENVNRVLKKLRQKKEEAVRSERFNLAVDLKKKERVCLDKKAELKKKVAKLDIKPTKLAVEDIAGVIASKTGIPMENILASNDIDHKNMDKKILKAIVGQDEAVQKVVSVLKRSYAGLSSPHRPLGSFLFLGPSGVGKTELAKVLAEKHFGDKSSLIRMDMSEFSESFTVSKLIGAPAGYVGYNENVKLGDQIRRKPYSVVLFDEIEKAHSDIFNLLLQILDEGRLTDSSGRELNFRNSVVIMTSNIGIDMLTKQAEIGFDAEKKNAVLQPEEVEATLRHELQNAFPLEFLNRIDNTVVFQPLTEAAMIKIVGLQFKEIKERLAERGINARLMATAKKHIVKESFSPDQGARRVRQMLSDLIEAPLADMILDGAVAPGAAVQVSAANGKISVKKQKG
ncbi:MAG: ATP-dependent Clp protease ATP-binding subunit [Candidatus Kerfeldbacteria bacterium]